MESIAGQKGLRRESHKSFAVNAGFLLFGWSASIPSDQRRSCRLWQAHPAQQVGVAWVGADATEDWINHDPSELIVSHLISLLQPFKRLVSLS
jgi:hypothetical protein